MLCDPSQKLTDTLVAKTAAMAEAGKDTAEMEALLERFIAEYELAPAAEAELAVYRSVWPEVKTAPKRPVSALVISTSRLDATWARPPFLAGSRKSVGGLARPVFFSQCGLALCFAGDQ